MVYDAFGAQPGTSLMGQSGFLTCSRERPCIKKIVDMFLNSILRTGMKKIICFISPFHVETVVCLSNKNAKPKDYVEIGVDAEDYYRIKDSGKSE